MDVPDRAEQRPESISVARCRELLGDDADRMPDEEVLAVACHAETLAHVVAERILPRASDLWVQASLDYKQRLQ